MPVKVLECRGVQALKSNSDPLSLAKGSKLRRHRLPETTSTGSLFQTTLTSIEAGSRNYGVSERAVLLPAGCSVLQKHKQQPVTSALAGATFATEVKLKFH